jgi:hypothetical protein
MFSLSIHDAVQIQGEYPQICFQLHAAIRKFDIKHPENAASIPYVRSKCLIIIPYCSTSTSSTPASS